MELKAGFYSLTCCGGCMLSVHDILCGHYGKMQVKSFNLLQSNDLEGSDISFVAGSAVTPAEENLLRKIREKSGKIVAVGACAVTGIITSKPISKIVNVDFSIRGCPIDHTDLQSVMASVLSGREPAEQNTPVCAECRARETGCLIEKGKDCLGPVSIGRCNSICTAAGTACIGCRGISTDSNTEAMEKLGKIHELDILGVKDADDK